MALIDEPDDAYARGYKSHAQGRCLERNPYRPSQVESRRLWEQGWRDSAADRQQKETERRGLEASLRRVRGRESAPTRTTSI